MDPWAESYNDLLETTAGLQLRLDIVVVNSARTLRAPVKSTLSRRRVWRVCVLEFVLE
jgi:hypothetical protein